MELRVSAVVSSSSYAAFLVTAVILIVIPGPDMLFIMAMAARGGWDIGFVAAVGTAVGLTLHTAAAVAGMSALFAAVPPLYELLRWAGAGYLLYLAVKAFRTTAPAADSPMASARGPTRTHAFWQGVVVDVLNPKTVLFFVALLPQFVTPDRGHTSVQLLVLGGTFVLLDLIIDGSIGLVSGRLAQGARRSRRIARWLAVGSGMVFAGLALRLAAAQR